MQHEARVEMVVSERWTPDHLDVTFVPMTYARPKASWIDGMRAYGATLRSDGRDRMHRRRDAAHTAVPFADITAAPAVNVPVRDRGSLSAAVRTAASRSLRALRHPQLRTRAG